MIILRLPLAHVKVWKLVRGGEGEGEGVKLNGLITQNQLSVQIPSGKMAKNEPSLIGQINILKDTVK